MAKNKKKKKQPFTFPTEAKGIFIIALNLLLIFSLFSFTRLKPHENYLGYIGYYSAFGFLYVFGLSSYLIGLYMIFQGLKLSLFDKPAFMPLKVIYFCFLLLSCCLLLNLTADVFPQIAFTLKDKVYSEVLLRYLPYPYTSTRTNLGGVPLFYLFKDLPVFNLQRLISNVGIALVFSTLALATFILLVGMKNFAFIKTIFVKIFQSLNNGLNQIPILFKKLKKFLTLPSPIRKKEKKHTYEPLYQKTELLEQKIKKIQERKKKESILEKPTPPLNRKKLFGYQVPPSALLTSPPKINHPALKKQLRRQAELLEETLLSFGIEAKVGQINCGPTITSFEVIPPVGVKVQKIKALEKDIALNLEARSIRIIAPIPGKAAVGVEIPSLYPQSVSLKEMLYHYKHMKRKHDIPLLLGKTVSGENIFTDLAKTPHLLIAGATGSGKSVCINTIVMSILMNADPDEIKLLMIDPKKVELTGYSKLPHMVAPVITEPHGAYAALQWLVKEMQQRYDILKQLGLRNITAFNNRKLNPELEESLSITIPQHMPFIVCIIDEFADLMMVSSADLETPIARIAQMARAVGIHLILATQRPSREVITGIIKANFPSRIAFKVASRINSQIILDETGAETLLGNGDLLFLPPGSSHLVRAQGAYISDDDINRTVSAICERNPPSYLIPSFDSMKFIDTSDEKNKPKDQLYDKALMTVLETKTASTTFLQRKLKIGYARAASLMDELEENGIIGPQEGSRPRQILASSEELE